MAKNKNWEETEWTICFHLPTGDVFPNKCDDFQKELDNNVLTWDNKDEAKEWRQSIFPEYHGLQRKPARRNRRDFRQLQALRQACEGLNYATTYSRKIFYFCKKRKPCRTKLRDKNHHRAL